MFLYTIYVCICIPVVIFQNKWRDKLKTKNNYLKIMGRHLGDNSNNVIKLIIIELN